MIEESTIRIIKEIGDIQKGSDLSIAVYTDDEDVRQVKALIIGPPDTPYQYGFFEFNMQFSNQYPQKPPIVTCTTTNMGRTRFNPNIYANGKVCLSILGTWRGESGEQWSPAQGMESILISIQSLMSGNPYENEPGYEHSSDKENQEKYVNKICHETLRITVIQKMEQYLGIDPSTGTSTCVLHSSLTSNGRYRAHPFMELTKQRFLWYYDSYEEAINNGMKEHRQGQAFTCMPFEGGSNIMNGNYDYPQLDIRLKRIRAVIESDIQTAAAYGISPQGRDSSSFHRLMSNFNQISNTMKQSGTLHEISIENENPFVWILTYFASPMGHLHGGAFRIRMTFTKNFPVEQPFVQMENPIFHLRVAKDGSLCYVPTMQKQEDIQHHISQIIKTLDENEPAYDPRACVNPEAFKLYWGSVQDRKMYSRRCRRSIEAAMEQSME